MNARTTERASPVNFQVMLDPRRFVRWDYIARLCVAAAIYVAAVFVWQSAVSSDTLVASLTFAATMVVTVGSAFLSEVRRQRVGNTFLMVQAMVDLAVVTAVVHVTGGVASQFAALYILVIAAAAVLLPTRGALLVAALGCVLYFGDIIVFHSSARDVGLILQLAVFGIVALGCGWIGGRLRDAGTGKAEELAAELEMVRLQGADILRNIRSGIVTIDEGGRLAYANPAAESLTGISLDRQVGHPILEPLTALAPELARALERTIRARIRTTRAEGTITFGGRTFPIGVTTTWSEGDGRPGTTTATAIFQDISDQKRLDQLHLRAERLEAVAELSASLAHEIKNPLASIRSAVEQLARMPAADEDASTLSGLIVRESDRLSRLLSEFLDFARVRVTQVGAVDVGAVARDAAGLVGAHPDRRDGVRIDCVAPTEPLLVEGDEDLLHRVIFNLALNAIQAAPAGGSVRIEAATLPAGDLPDELTFERGAVALRITDDGPGIPEAMRERLFDPFTTTKPGGSGLGLAVVQRAIDAHKGLVFVDSAEGGTQFTVLLPRTQSASAVPQ